MADRWRQFREEVQTENYLVRLPRQHITLDDAEQLLERLRVIEAAIKRRDNINLEILDRYEALRKQVININATVVPRLSIPDFNQRFGVYADERRAVLLMDPPRVSERERQDYIMWYRQLCDYLDSEPRLDLTARSTYRWVGVALLRLNCERDDHGLSLREREDLSELRDTMIEVLEDDLLNADLPPSEYVRTRSILLELVLSAHEEASRTGRPVRRRPARARSGSASGSVSPSLHSVDEEDDHLTLLGDDIGGLRIDELEHHVPPQPSTERDRLDAILVLFPTIPLESLPAAKRTCHICQEDYGTPIDGGDMCLPRAAPCCPPNTFGGICLVKWFLEDNGPKLCPLCRHDWRDEIRSLANALATD